MTERPPDPLRAALNEMEMLRRRSLWITRFLIVCAIVCWVATDAVVLLKGNVGFGLVLALDAAMAGIFAVGINIGGCSCANTIKILTAIERLGAERSRPDAAQ